jgi:Zn-dependent protease
MQGLARLFLAAFAFLKFGKLFTSMWTMLVVVVIYGFLYGWKYAIAVVALLFLHEMGHFIAGRHRGLEMGLPTFIPFLGAWTGVGGRIPDAETQAYMGMGGPLLGTIASFVCWFFARSYDLPWLLAASYTGFLLNLVNLAPILPFDGGHVMAVLSPRLWLLGVPVLLGLFWWNHSPVMLLIAILAAPYVMQALRFKADSPEVRAYYAATARTRWTYGIYYLVLVLFLSVMVAGTHAQLTEMSHPDATPSADGESV